MAGINLTVNNQDIAAALGAAAAQVSDLTPLYARISEYLLRSTRQRFRDQVAPDGTPWQALSKKYQRRKHRNTDKVLTLHGYLQGTLRGQYNQDGLEFGSDRVYAAIHQLGGGTQKMPARPFLGVNDDDSTHILQLARNFVRQTLPQ